MSESSELEDHSDDLTCELRDIEFQALDNLDADDAQFITSTASYARLEILRLRADLTKAEHIIAAYEVASVQRGADLHAAITRANHAEADLAAVTEERDRLREALKPFAAQLDHPGTIYEHDGVRMALVNQDILDRLCRRARAALEGVTEPASPWRDIESAPKDKKILIAGKMDDGTDYQEVCKYFDAANCWPIVLMDGYLAPTHWMHLQDPPR